LVQEVLQANKNQMVNAFKELLQSKIIEPLVHLVSTNTKSVSNCLTLSINKDELLQALSNELELVAFAYAYS
jgi:hypothetical protein